MGGPWCPPPGPAAKEPRLERAEGAELPGDPMPRGAPYLAYSDLKLSGPPAAASMASMEEGVTGLPVDKGVVGPKWAAWWCGAA